MQVRFFNHVPPGSSQEILEVLVCDVPELLENLPLPVPNLADPETWRAWSELLWDALGGESGVRTLELAVRRLVSEIEDAPMHAEAVILEFPPHLSPYVFGVRLRWTQAWADENWAGLGLVERTPRLDMLVGLHMRW